MDEHYEKRGQEVPWLKMKPSDYFRRQCFISCDPDEPNIDTTVNYVGAECFVFATDYAHWDGVADPVTEFLEHSRLPDEVNRLILRENAGRLLRLPTVIGSGV
jgi:predicted TIM-barrel fold metal-dependent hydrolase